MSVVVPAHDEGQVISTTLQSVIDQDFDGVLDIVVVANGCRDDTVSVARRFEASASKRGWCRRVVERVQPGKPGALNRGDALKKYGDTLYLDADVVLSDGAISTVYDALHRNDGVLMASPRLVVAPSASWVTRSYGRVWSRLPYVENNVRGVGCYAVSAEGRRRWDEYPELMADDRFARLHFGTDEQRMVEGGHYVWPLPEGARELVQVRSRWLLGNDELYRAMPSLFDDQDRRYAGLPGMVARNPRLWPDIGVFVVVYGLAMVRMWQRRRSGDYAWDRAVRARLVST